MSPRFTCVVDCYLAWSCGWEKDWGLSIANAIIAIARHAAQKEIQYHCRSQVSMTHDKIS